MFTFPVGFLAEVSAGGGGPPAKTAYASDFDGTNDYLSRGQFTGAADGQKGIISVWVNMSGSSDSTNYGYMNIGDSGGLILYRTASGKVNLQLKATDLSSVWNVTSSTNVVATLGWVNIMASWDAAINARHFWVNGIDQSPGAISNKTINYNVSGGTNNYVGSTVSAVFRLNGCMSELYFNQAEYIDLSIEANRLKIVTSDGKPADMGADGSDLTGSQPILYLPNAYSSFEVNAGTGGDFSVTGALAACASSPSD